MVNVRSIRAILLAAICFLILTQSACSVFSAIGGWFSQGYENTVAYFNAYYNAKRLFDEAEADVLAARRAVRSKGSVTSPAPQAGSTSKQKFAAVIDKCSNVLSFYPKSSVVDDALFLIGKSYYYQEDFLKAERKFTELIAQAPTGSLVYDAQLWLLKTMQKLGKYEDARRVGDELCTSAANAGKNRIVGEAFAILGDVATAQNKTDEAIDRYSKSVAAADDGVLQAATQAKVGDLYASLQDYEKAANAYLDVQKYSPDDYDLYYTQMQAALAFRNIQRYDAALGILRKLEANYRFLDYQGAIRLELGTTQAKSGQFDEAVRIYRRVDTTYAKTEQGARAAYELGKLLQFQFGNYADAKVSYSRALIGGPLDLTAEAQRRASALERYFRLQQEFFKLDSVLFALDIDSLWMRKDTTARRAAEDSAAAVRDTNRVKVVRDTLRDRPDTVIASQRADTTQARIPDRAVNMVKPRKDTLLASLGKVSLQVGELFYSDLDVPDSTFYWISQSLRYGLDSVRAPRALFVLAEVVRTKPERKYGDEKDLYRRLIDQYPKSTYAEEARVALGFPRTPKKEDPAVPLYAAAESLMVAGQYKGALDSLERIVRDFSESPLVPKSRYAMAWLYENNLSSPDSAISQYKALVAKYATTKYGAVAQRRIPPPPTPPRAGSDSTKRAFIDTTKKAIVDTTKGALPDSISKARLRTVLKLPADSSARLLKPQITGVDSTKKLIDFDEREKLDAAAQDSLRSRRVKRPVVKD